MHELSVCEAIADTVTARSGGRPVDYVRVRIGALRQVVPEPLEFCWEMLTDATPLDGARLEVETVPAVVRCGRCGNDTTLDIPLFMCGSCGDDGVEIVSGEEFLLVEIGCAEVH